MLFFFFTLIIPYQLVANFQAQGETVLYLQRKRRPAHVLVDYGDFVTDLRIQAILYPLLFAKMVKSVYQTFHLVRTYTLVSLLFLGCAEDFPPIHTQDLLSISIVPCPFGQVNLCQEII